MELKELCACDPDAIAAKLGDLPELPIAANDVLRMINADSSDASSIARVISLDQALAARILRIANSSFYGLSRQIKTLQDAVVILGAKVIRNLVVAMSVKSLHHKFDTLERNLWEEAVGYACGARFIAHQRSHINPEEAFLVGLLCNIGELICNNSDTASYRTLLEEEISSGRSRNQIALSMFGYTFAQSSAVILDKWNLAPEISICTLLASDLKIPANVGTEITNLAQCVFISRGMCSHLGIGNNIEPPTGPEIIFKQGDFACSDTGAKKLLEEFAYFFNANKREILYA